MKIYNHINKMGIFNNIDRYTNVDISQYIRNISQIIHASRGMKLDSDNNYSAENKRLKNVAEGTSSSDAITKHQLTVGLNQKHDNTRNIDLKDSCDIINSKPQSVADLVKQLR